MSVVLLIVGILTGLFCLSALFEVVTAPTLAATAGTPNPITAVDVIVLGIYLTVTVICFAGVGIINALKKASRPTERLSDTTAPVHVARAKPSELDFG